MSSEVVDVPARSRFELAVNGETSIVQYELVGNRVVLTHTEVPPALSGQGIGSRLAKGVIELVGASGRRAVPQCEFIAGWLAKHPEYDGIVDR